MPKRAPTLRRVHLAARRYAAVEMVEAYILMGFSATAAVVSAANELAVSPRSVWAWRSQVAGWAASDSYMRLKSLDWGMLPPPGEVADAR